MDIFSARGASYDIEVTDDPFGQIALYKHIQQSWILPTMDVEVTKFQEERKEESDKDWDEHVRQIGKDIIQKHIGVLKELYQEVREVPSGLAMKLAEQAESEEERKFYAFIMTMNLQRKQKEAIEKNLF